jgi:putative colanic acid biosynthesis acetyltransferase WcaF
MIELDKYREQKNHRLRRLLWLLVNCTLFRVSPSFVRNGLLRLFGAHIGKSLVYRTVDIYDPANLSIGNMSCIGPHVEIYCKDKVAIGDNSVISQWAYVCTASHDVQSPVMALTTKPISIGNGVWVASRAVILPGADLGNGSVVGAGAVVAKRVDEWTVVAGNPATVVKQRILRPA